MGSGDAGREEEEEAVETDAAPPERRNGAQERLGLGAGADGVGLGADVDAGTGSGGVSCREREPRRRPDCEGVGEVSPDEGRCGLCPDLRRLL